MDIAVAVGLSLLSLALLAALYTVLARRYVSPWRASLSSLVELPTWRRLAVVLAGPFGVIVVNLLSDWLFDTTIDWRRTLIGSVVAVALLTGFMWIVPVYVRRQRPR